MRRRALLLSAHKAAVYHWRRGDLDASFLFDANEEGRDFFARYLRETPSIPMHILVDVFEEEFRRETIPHVFGSDRNAIVARKKARLFRDTPFFTYAVQGRETEGRRDDRILMTAITNPGILNPWIKLMDEQRVPLAGVHSIALFTRSLVKLLGSVSDNMLIISLQSISGLRQTFIQKGELRMSRLVQLPRYGTEPYGPYVRNEVEKIRRYLNSLRLSGPEDAVDIYMLLTGDLLDETRSVYKDSSLNRYHLLDINDLMRKGGSKRKISAPFSDQLFVHQLLKEPPPNAYASGTDRRYFIMRRARQSMLAASAVLLLGGAAWGGFNFMDGLGYKQRSLSAQQKTQFYTARYEMARERLPQTPVEPNDIQVAVDLAELLKQYKSSPVDMMQLISHGMQKLPTVQVDSLQWAVSFDPNADISSEGRAGTTSSPAQPQSATVPGGKPAYKFYQIALLNGRLDPFNGDFRGAIDTINHFAETLRTMDKVYDVRILTMPLDVSSTAHLQGSAEAQQKDAHFSMRIVLGSGDET